MKILHISALDGQTGAGVAAARIHTGLIERGVASRFCVAYPSAGLKNAFTPRVTLARRLERAVRVAIDARLLAPHSRGYDYVLSTGFAGHDIRRIVESERPDVVHLHWIAGNSYRLATLAGICVPIVWRLSDMWPFCGIAHLEPDHTQYVYAPVTAGVWPLSRDDLPERVRRRKRLLYAALPNLSLAVPSRWLMAETRRSALLGERPIELIPTSCDTSLFLPRDRRACRVALGLPLDAKLVLVGATSMATHWKGGDLLVKALEHLAAADDTEGIRIVTFGKDPMEAPELSNKIGFDHIGQVRDRRMMSILYNAADVFVAPSRMENLANTVLEALACGTPTVAFAIGGMPDMIDHQVNGWLAPPFAPDRLAAGIKWAIGKAGNPAVRQAARDKILLNFSLDQELDSYMSLYERLRRTRRERADVEGPARAL